MIQIIIIAIVLIAFFLYLRGKGDMKIKRPRDELDLRCDFYKEQIMNFLRRVRRTRSKTRLRRLESEIERFHKVMELDDLLEKAERENNPRKAIDYYLEALAFIMKHNFEKERKNEIEERIKQLQKIKGNEVRNFL